MGKIEVYPSHKEASESKWSKNEVFSVKNSTEMIYRKTWETPEDPHAEDDGNNDPSNP